jgi:hypothetical protein
MVRLRLGVFVLVTALLAGNWLVGQDKKDDTKDPPPKGTTLPKYFKQLGLTDKQKTQILTLVAEHQAKITALNKQITDLRAAEKKQVEEVLTDEQRARLRELRLGESDKDKKDKEDKKDKGDKKDKEDKKDKVE